MKVAFLALCLTSIASAQTLPTVIAGVGSSYAFGVGFSGDSYRIGGIIRDTLNARSGETTKYSFKNKAVPGSYVYNVTDNQAAELKTLDVAAVYMVSGGNDYSYYTCLRYPTSPVCKNAPTDAFKKGYMANYTAALDKIKANVAINGKQPPIFPVTYLQALDDKTPTGTALCPLDNTQKGHAMAIYDALVNTTVDAIATWKNKAENKGYPLYPIWMHNITSTGHHIQGPEPYVNGQTPATNDGQDWHPTKAGAKAMANAILDAKLNSLPK